MNTQNFELKSLKPEIKSLVDGEPNLVANLANISAQIFHTLPDLNWCGFYLLDAERNELVLGPFQGKPACIRIAKGRGVCGTAWREGRALNIADVNAIANHIACDSASRSELVIPLYSGAEFKGVLDIDSPVADRFDKETESLLIEIAKSTIEPLFSRF